MTTARKIKTNRKNAQTSTGPKTARGKAFAVQNAHRHGLSIPVISYPQLSEQVELLAREIAGEVSNDEIYYHARLIAEAEVDLIRIRRARDDCLIRKLNDPFYISHSHAKLLFAFMRKFVRHGEKVPIPLEMMSLRERSKPQSPENFLSVLAELRKELYKIDRYERRALFRRKFAIRAFDLARRKALATQ